LFRQWPPEYSSRLIDLGTCDVLVRSVAEACRSSFRHGLAYGMVTARLKFFGPSNAGRNIHQQTRVANSNIVRGRHAGFFRQPASVSS
jgi:hypothetical protein